MRLSLLLPALVLCTGMASVAPALADAGGGPAVQATPSGCPVEAWGSLPKSAPGLSPGHIDRVRVATGPCADRIVFDITGPTPGFNVRYVSQITADGSGAVIPVAGGARLLIVVNTNGHDINTGRVTLQDVPRINSRFRTFRALVLAGDFEGLTSLGLGVRARLPFRAFTLPGPGKNHNRVVVDVAHFWR